MADARVVEAQQEYMNHIADNLRKADLDEIKAAGNSSARECLANGLNVSSKCWVALIDDEPACVFGVAPISILGGVGAPWLLGTDKLFKVRRRFLTDSRIYFKEMLKLYPVLQNYVDARNSMSIRWLKWLGFSILPAVRYGINDELFHPFIARAKDV